MKIQWYKVLILTLMFTPLPSYANKIQPVVELTHWWKAPGELTALKAI